MGWVLFVAGAVLSWASTACCCTRGRPAGNPLKALLCVGVAYFLIGVLVPVGALSAQGGLSQLQQRGLIDRDDRRRARRDRRRVHHLRLPFGGLPLYVMPLVFGGAPIVNVFFSMMLHPPKNPVNPMLYVGLVFASVGAAMVLYFRPAS
jgi:hypothetical protein